MPISHSTAFLHPPGRPAGGSGGEMGGWSFRSIVVTRVAIAAEEKKGFTHFSPEAEQALQSLSRARPKTT